MKTDREKLEELLKLFGVGTTTEGENSIEIMAGDTKVKGYSGFYASFNFDKDGKFETVGVWE